MELPEGLRKLDVMRLNLRFIQACGYLREDSISAKRMLVLLMDVIKYIIILLFFTYLVGASVELYRLRNNPHDSGEAIVFIITTIKTMFKLVSLVRNKSEYLRLIGSFSDVYIHDAPLSPKQSSILKSYFSRANKLTKSIWYISTIMTFAFVGKVSPADDVGDTEFVPAWESSSRVTLPFQTAQSPLYPLRVIYTTVATAVGFFVTTILNTLGFLLVIYLTAQFALLVNTVKDAAGRVLQTAGEADGMPALGGELTCTYIIPSCYITFIQKIFL